MNNIIHTTGVKSEKGHYINMGITEKSAFLYGCNASQIENITFEVSDDQSPANTELMEYWGGLIMKNRIGHLYFLIIGNCICVFHTDYQNTINTVTVRHTD
jgi:hypothetical protein